MANWERKSEYLLREIVKFRTYVDCLRAGDARKREIYRERGVVERGLRGEDEEVEVEGGEGHGEGVDGVRESGDEGGEYGEEGGYRQGALRVTVGMD
jgi:hypothetical protein